MSLYPVGGGRHYIRIKAGVRKEAGIQGGDRVGVQEQAAKPETRAKRIAEAVSQVRDMK